MKRTTIAWLLSVPLMLAGTEVAHALAFRVVYPSQWARAQALQETGHGYFAWLPALAAVGAATLLAALFLSGRNAVAGRHGAIRTPSLRRFAAMPPLAFVLQEHLERLLHGVGVFGVVLDPTFLVGLALQAPFALAAYLLARLLLGVAERAGRALGRRAASGRRRTPAAGPAWSRFQLGAPRIAALALGYAERGPPV